MNKQKGKKLTKKWQKFTVLDFYFLNNHVLKPSQNRLSCPDSMLKYSKDSKKVLYINMVTVVEIAGVSAGISKYSMYLGHIQQYQPWKGQENLVEPLFSFATFKWAWLVTILLLRRFKFSRVFSAYCQLFFCKQPFRNLRCE